MTDEEGLFDISGLPAGAVKVNARHEDYLAAELELDLEEDLEHVELVLRDGLRVTGRVVDPSAQPVESAFISAETDDSDHRYRSASTDKNGEYEIKAMADGEWKITADHDDWAPAVEKAVNPALRPRVDFVLKEKETATIVGTVSNLDPEAIAWIYVRGQGFGAGSAYSEVDADGHYEIEDSPTGLLSVEAIETLGQRQRSQSKVAEVAAGSKTTVDIDFDEGLLVSGRVTKAGEAVFGASVDFSGTGHISTSTVTDVHGYYEVQVSDGSYNVRVREVGKRAQERQLDVQETMVFDIDIAEAVLRGVVVDASTLKPVPGADVDVEVEGARGGYFGGGSVVTDSGGRFYLDNLGAAPYIIRVEHKDYSQWRRVVSLDDGEQLDLEVALEKHDGLVVFLTDARSGAFLSGTVVARNNQGTVIFDGHPQTEGQGVRLRIPPGTYKISASANRFATTTVNAPVPGQDVTIPLTKGGTLKVRSAESINRLARLLMPSGEEYVRCWCNRIAELRLEGGLTTFENIAAGFYTLVVNERDGSKSPYPVTVIEGQEVEVSIK